MAPRGLGSFIGMPVVGMIMAKVDARKLLGIGIPVCAFTLLQLSRLNLRAGYWDFFWPQFIMGLALGLIFVPLTTVSMDPIPKEGMGNATSLFNLVRNLGGSIGISTVNTIQVRQAQADMHLLGAHVNPYNPAAGVMLRGMQQVFITHGSDPTDALHQAQGAIFGMVQQQAAMMAYNTAFEILGATFLVMIPFIFLLQRPKSKGPVMAH